MNKKKIKKLSLYRITTLINMFKSILEASGISYDIFNRYDGDLYIIRKDQQNNTIWITFKTIEDKGNCVVIGTSRSHRTIPLNNFKGDLRRTIINAFIESNIFLIDISDCV